MLSVAMYKVFRSILSHNLVYLNQDGFLSTNKSITRFNFHKQNILRNLSMRKNVYLLDETNSIKNNCVNDVNQYTKRSHTCGELNRGNIGQRVVLCGWLEYQRMNKFIVLRDSYGEIQLIIDDKDKVGQKLLNHTPYETILEVEGTVMLRPEHMINMNQKTGDVEVKVERLKLINKARSNLPFNIREFQKAKETLRMQYRYLDIRFPQMQRNLRLRSKLLMKMREFLIDNHFIDVETPTLFKATPGGAQEFVVPTRFPGKFYSLVQSPQQFKQMLMAGALDRYFQIAKCYRDEGTRPDRQPEFTQLDIELSFTDVNCVLRLIEDLLCSTLSEFSHSIPAEFPRMSYEEALESYGCDKPDVTFDFKLQNCTYIFKNNAKINSVEDFGAYILIFNQKDLQENGILTKSVKEKHIKLAEPFQKAKLIQSKVILEQWPTKMANIFTRQEIFDLYNQFSIEDNSIVFLTYGKRHDARQLLGKIRLEYVNHLEKQLGVGNLRKSGFHFLWIVDFPLFELDPEGVSLLSSHHPFTSPHPADIHLLENDPLKVRALAYDLVLNGNEVGGGSIRIHDPVLQEKVLNLLQIEKDTLQHIIEMLGSGCPPHGGLALGLDRLLAILLKTDSIRDVMAFPKTFEGKDPISHAPSEISKDTLKLYHIQVDNDNIS